MARDFGAQWLTEVIQKAILKQYRHPKVRPGGSENGRS
jgi:hypothetical protein